MFAHFAQLGVHGPVGVFVGADPKHSTENIVQVTQSGLGMPDRDYYLKQDPKMASTREAYVAYITQLFTLAKQPDPAGAASAHSRARNDDRDAAVGARAESRPQCDVQQDDGRRARGADAVVQLDALPRPGRT